MAKKLSEETIKLAIKLYKTGLSSDTIGEKLGSKGQTITKYLIKEGIEIRGPKKKLSEEDKKEMAKLYQEGLSMPKIAEKYNVSDALVLRYLKQQGIKSRSAEEAHRKYPINEDFFDVIDTEEKAYFLGFLYAAGCNHKDVNYISLSLDISDREILEKLVVLIYKEKPLCHVKISDRTKEKKGITSYFTINSKHICKQLEKLGCMQAKTFLIEYPNWMPEDLHRHFIRGYFDGDGGLNINTKKWQGSSLKITSTHQFITRIKELIESQIDIHFSYYKAKNSDVYDIAISGDRTVRNMLEWMYDHATIYMKRKYDLYLKLLEEIEKTNELIRAGTQGYSKRYLDK